jgi:hypothetical protein
MHSHSANCVALENIYFFVSFHFIFCATQTHNKQSFTNNNSEDLCLFQTFESHHNDVSSSPDEGTKNNTYMKEYCAQSGITLYTENTQKSTLAWLYYAHDHLYTL